MRALIVALVAAVVLGAAAPAMAVTQAKAGTSYRTAVSEYVMQGRAVTGGCFVSANDGWFRCYATLKTKAVNTVQVLGCVRRTTARIVFVDISRVARQSDPPSQFACVPASTHPGGP